MLLLRFSHFLLSREKKIVKNLFRLFGGYEALVAGKAKDAMVDMTGGVAEGIEIKDYKNEEERKKLFKILRKSKENMSLISTSIAVSNQLFGAIN